MKSYQLSATGYRVCRVRVAYRFKRLLKNLLSSPSTSSGYAQGERNWLIFLASPFVLSVVRKAKSKHKQLFQHPTKRSQWLVFLIGFILSSSCAKAVLLAQPLSPSTEEITTVPPQTSSAVDEPQSEPVDTDQRMLTGETLTQPREIFGLGYRYYLENQRD